ncbi:hypothetical protein R1sor_011386 [Riccia sorocarpa]|uniref:Uncharacterized protein n=1 Tax=Riccia sorocarpa TaxID=122646 RepID=A0ABD3I4M7_9MARC
MAQAVAEDINQEDSNDQGSLGEALQQVNTGEHEEDGTLALVLHHSRSLDSSHFEGIPPVPLFQSPEQSVQDNAPVSSRETLDINEDNPVLEDRIIQPHVLTTDQNEDGISSVQQDLQAVINASGPLVYVEGFMDRSSKTAAGDVVGAKKVIRRNGVQEFITRCLELFDIAFWTCSDRNLLYDYTQYLFSGEQWDKFLFRWDQGKTLDTKERWTRNNREIRLVLKSLKSVWGRVPVRKGFGSLDI